MEIHVLLVPKRFIGKFTIIYQPYKKNEKKSLQGFHRHSSLKNWGQYPKPYDKHVPHLQPTTGNSLIQGTGKTIKATSQAYQSEQYED